MTAQPHPSDPRHVGQIPRDLVDRFFDRELDEGSREKFFGMLRGDISRCAEVAKTQRILSMLRDPLPAPDLTADILDGIDRRRRFLPERLRRMVKAGRLAAAACVALAVLGIALTNRYAPGVFRLTPRAAPLSQVIESGATDLAGAVGSVKARVSEPAPRQIAEGQPPRNQRLVLSLSPGATSVKLLPRRPESALELPLGSGGETRFATGGVLLPESAPGRPAFGLIWPLGLSDNLGTDARIVPPFLPPPSRRPAEPGTNKDVPDSDLEP